VRIGAQPGGRDPGIAPVVLSAGDTEAIAQTAKPRSSNASTTGPCGTSIATAPASPSRASTSRRVPRGLRRCQQMLTLPQSPRGCRAGRPSAAASPSRRRRTSILFPQPWSCPPVSHGPPRRLAESVPALEGATSYWACVLANLPGHRSSAGAPGTSARMVAPGRPTRTASLHRC
jgi:hypothetical protein